jgi:transposase InsO family protein
MSHAADRSRAFCRDPRRPSGEPGDLRQSPDLPGAAGLGVTCSCNRVARVMRKYEITARPLRRFVVTTDSRHTLPVAPNRLEQKSTAERPNTHWFADITFTYLWTGEG